MAKAKYNHSFRYDITTLKAKEPVLEAFPELQLQPVLVRHGTGDYDKWLRFAFYYASIGSDLHRHYSDNRLKKLEAMKLSGINAESEEAKQTLDNWKFEPALALVCQVVRMDNNRRWTRLFHGSEYYNRSFERMASEGDDTKVRDFEYLSQVGDALDELEKSLFRTDAELAAAAKELELKNQSSVAQRSKNESFTEHDDDDEEEG